MNSILLHAPDNLTLRLKADADLLNVQKFLQPFNQFLPLGPLRPGTSIREALDFNLIGAYAGHYGMARNLLLNATLKTGIGIVRTGADVMKNVSGYDLTKLIIGARGSLGRILEATFRIDAIPSDLKVDYTGKSPIISDGVRLVLPPVMVEKVSAILEQEKINSVSVVPLGIIDIGNVMTELGEEVLALVRKLDGYAGVLKDGRFHCGPAPNRALMDKLKSVFDPQEEFPEYED